jgi:hypothetical protein
MTTILLDYLITDDSAFIVRDQRLDESTVTAYAEEPERLPPVEVWREPDTGQVYLLDGQHRVEAARRRRLAEIPITTFEGSRPEAEARARVANLWHGLPLTGSERRRVRMEVIERLYEYSNNWIAEDFLRCSSNTVAALRSNLEEAGRIPRLERFQRKGGGTTPRTREHINDDAEDKVADDGLFGAERNIRPPADLLAPDPIPNNNDGGYDAGADNDDDDEPSGGEPARPNDGGGRGTALFQQTAPALPRQITLKLAQIGEPLAVEVVLYVNGEAHSVPVTLLVADGPISGLPETGPDHQRAFIIGAETARKMGLLGF